MARKVLVIDDERDIINMIIARLVTHGFNVISANDGESGFEKARKYLPDVILLDLNMSGRSGIETANRLKKNHGTANIPVIFLSGTREEGISKKYLEINDYHIISKPFKAQDLLTILATHYNM